MTRFLDPRTLSAAERDPYFRAPTLGTGGVAAMHAAAAAGNVAAHYGVGGAPVFCPPGYGMYQGKCIPKTRVQAMVGAAPMAKVYVVKKGDKTSTIAKKLGVSVTTLLSYNKQKPVMRLRSGEWVFHSLTPGEKIRASRAVGSPSGRPTMAQPKCPPGSKVDSMGICRTPQGRPVYPSPKVNGLPRMVQNAAQQFRGAVAAPRSLGAEGDACTDAQGGPGVEDANGNCISTGSIHAGTSNAGQYCTDANGNPGYTDSNGNCIATSTGGGGGSGQGITGVVCGSANMHVDFSQLPPVCVCDDGYYTDANGDCVQGTAPTATATVLCTATGGQGDDSNCVCPPGYTFGSSGCVDAQGKPGGITGGAGGATPPTGGGGGGGGITKPTGGAGTTKPGTGAASSLTAPKGLSTGMLVGLLGAAALVVGGGAYYFTRGHKGGKGAKAGHKPAHKSAHHR